MQQKKNSRSYKRTLTYLYLQKLTCPKCNKILGGKATTKKNGNVYYYYYCNDCKINLKENVVSDYFDNFIEEICEYDSVVNGFFLPMLKNKINNPKDTLEKENYKLKQTIENLNYQINEDKKEISKLKFTINNLKQTISYWKDKFDKLISFLHSKIHNWYDKDDKYLNVINDMYKDEVLDDEDIEDMGLNAEKDDFGI